MTTSLFGTSRSFKRKEHTSTLVIDTNFLLFENYIINISRYINVNSPSKSSLLTLLTSWKADSKSGFLCFPEHNLVSDWATNSAGEAVV